MTISQQLKAILDAATMQAWAAETNASVSIASDLNQALTFLSNKPGAPRAVIVYNGEDKAGEHEECGRVDRSFLIVVSRGQSLTLDQKDFVAEDNAGGLPLYDLVEGCRDAVRGVRFDVSSTDVFPNYKRTSRFSVGDALYDAYQIEITIGTQLDAAI